MLYVGNLRALREARGLTIREVADALRVGRMRVTRWESGESGMHLEQLSALSELYDADVTISNDRA